MALVLLLCSLCTAPKYNSAVVLWFPAIFSADELFKKRDRHRKSQKLQTLNLPPDLQNVIASACSGQ
ncbi:hypothetical protein EXN66_Car008071 [Channa argus]|uniref:Secreted protein n=1 Tax=Channa argus TaxID=215402 RepID=A0A6G1PQ43_CHAAH|nr:hypothetical protein EXN66_Car008071 [Channa argus]